MSASRRSLVVITAALAAIPAFTHAATYTDSQGDYWGGLENDITAVTVTNDATSLTFHVDFNPGANFTNNYYAHLELGIQIGDGAGGQTAINTQYGTDNTAAGNPWGQAVGISTGMNLFAGIYPDGPGYLGGTNLYRYTPTGWTQLTTTDITEIPTGTPSIEFSFPLATLGLTPGDTIKFDIWSTYGDQNSAYDALDNPYSPFFGTTDLPYANNGNPPANYDSASTLSFGTYTLAGAHLTGDTNGDGLVDLADLNNVLNNFGGSGAGNPGDENQDNTVDLTDLNNVLNNFGSHAAANALSVPEPASLAACGLAPFALIRRRRRPQI